MSPANGMSPCGTYAGWSRHQRRGEPSCDACRAAATTYQRQRRSKNQTAYRRERDEQNARQRALWKLAKRYPRVFAKLYRAELEDAP